jgi:hypothetical protein
MKSLVPASIGFTAFIALLIAAPSAIAQSAAKRATKVVLLALAILPPTPTDPDWRPRSS